MEQLFLPCVLFALGLFIIIKGGDAFVDAAAWLSEVTGIPKLIVGATVISLATTLPEQFVSAIATAQGSIGIATGNAIGSVIANIGIGMAMSLIAGTAVISISSFAPKALLMMGTAVTLMVLGLDGSVSIFDGVILLVILAFYIGSNVKSAARAQKEMPAEARPLATPATVAQNGAKFVLGAAGIILGANLLVDNGKIIAAALGVSEEVIGLTIIAVGTSLPELVTAVSAIVKKEAALTVGNVIGANIIDTALILPLCAFISGGTLEISRSTVFVDIPVALALMAVAIFPTLKNKGFKKWQGIVLLGIYIVYISYVVMFV